MYLCHKRLARFHSAPHKVVDRVKLNAAVHHDGDIPKAVGGADGHAGHVARPDGRRAGTPRGTLTQVFTGRSGSVTGVISPPVAHSAARAATSPGQRNSFRSSRSYQRRSSPDTEAPGGAAVIFRRGKLNLRPIGAKTYTNRATENFIRACHFPHRSRAAFGAGAVGATALRASQHTLSMFSAASGASLSIKKVATIRFFAVS